LRNKLQQITAKKKKAGRNRLPLLFLHFFLLF